MRRFNECDICGDTFESSDSLREHVNSHSKMNRHSCHQCDRKFGTKSRLKVHVNQEHSVALFEDRVAKLEDKCLTLQIEKEDLAQQLKILKVLVQVTMIALKMKKCY